MQIVHMAPMWSQGLCSQVLTLKIQRRVSLVCTVPSHTVKEGLSNFVFMQCRS